MQTGLVHSARTAATLIAECTQIRANISTQKAIITAIEQTQYAESAISRARTMKRIQKEGSALYRNKPPMPLQIMLPSLISEQRAPQQRAEEESPAAVAAEEVPEGSSEP